MGWKAVMTFLVVVNFEMVVGRFVPFRKLNKSDEREDSTSNHVFGMAKVSVDEREDSTSNHVFGMAKASVSVDEREDSTSNHVFDMAKVWQKRIVHP